MRPAELPHGPVGPVEVVGAWHAPEPTDGDPLEPDLVTCAATQTKEAMEMPKVSRDERLPDNARTLAR